MTRTHGALAEDTRATELASTLFGLGGLLAMVGLFVPGLRPANMTIGAVTAGTALLTAVVLRLIGRRWTATTLRWTVIVVALLHIILYNLATQSEPYRTSVFFFFLVLWIGLTQPRWTTLQSGPLFLVAYLVPVLVHDATQPAVLSSLFVVPTLLVAGELMGWFTAQRTQLREELAEAVRELETVDQRRDLHLDTASHELRGPLAAIRTSLQTLEERGDRIEPEQVAALVQVCVRQVDRMQRMVDDMLAGARMRSGSITCQPRVVDVGGELPELLATSLLEATTIDHVAIRATRLVVDPDHLAQVMNNLLANAHRHGEPPVEITATMREDEVELAVADHGPGIPPERTATLFDQYAHEGETTGLGLGLHIVRQLLELNGGSIHYEDNEPQGARFVFRLPRAGPAT